MAAGHRLRRAAARGHRRPARRPRTRTGTSSPTDIAHAADILRPYYDELDGADGFVSIEVSPDLAHDTDGDDRAGAGAVGPARPART